MQLSSLQLSSLLEEIASMVAARRPIAAGLSDLRHKSMGQIGVAAKQLSIQLDAGECPADAIASVSGRFAPMARVAMQCVTRTGSTEPVYLLAAVLRRRHERQTRAAVARIYPAMTLLVAYLVASLGLSTLLIEMATSEIVQLSVPPWLLNASHWLQRYFWIPILVLVGLLLCVRLIAHLKQDDAFKFFPWSTQTEELTNWASFCEMLAIAIESGFAFDEAVEVAAESSGDGRWRKSILPTIEAIQSGAVRPDDASSQLPPLLRWRMSQLAHGRSPAPSADEIRNLAQWYHLRSQRRWQFWSEWFPLLSTIGIMTILVLALCLLVVKPIYDLS